MTRRRVLAAACAAALAAVVVGAASANPAVVPEASAPAAAPDAKPAAEAAPALTLETLMEGMATTVGVEATFVEVKEIALLQTPLESRGVMVFVPPDRLARETTQPSPASLVIDGSQLRFRDAVGGDDVDLSGNPVAREFVENMIVLFNGDLAELRRRYDVGFEAQGERWTLTLTPRLAPVKDFVSTIHLRGAGRALAEMVVAETDGDRTVTRFEDVRIDRAFAPDELARWFERDGAAPTP